MAAVIPLDGRRAARERQRAVAAAVAAEVARRERELGTPVPSLGSPRLRVVPR